MTVLGRCHKAAPLLMDSTFLCKIKDQFTCQGSRRTTGGDAGRTLSTTLSPVSHFIYRPKEVLILGAGFGLKELSCCLSQKAT